MLKFISILGLLVTLSPLFGQGIRPVGSVGSIEDSGKRITLKTDSGPEIQVISNDKTQVVKVKPGQTSLTGATPLQLSDITTGDRILVQGALAEDQKSIPARRIVVMTKNELANKQSADLADWNRRGIFGVVSALDPAAKTITVNVRTGMPGQSESRSVQVQLNDSTVTRRYAPDSIQFSDSVIAPFSEIKPGDQLRARGEKSPDGSSITAQEVISGLFYNIAATVISVDPATKALKVNDLDSKKPVTVKISSDSSLKKMQPMMAQMIATRLNNTQQPQGGSSQNPQPPQQRAPSGSTRVGGGPGGLFGPGGPGSGPPGAAPGGGQLFDRLPSFELQEVKPGDALIISAPAGKVPGEITATMIVAGVEPILTAPSKNRQSILGSWNVDMSGGGMGMQ